MNSQETSDDESEEDILLRCGLAHGGDPSSVIPLWELPDSPFELPTNVWVERTAPDGSDGFTMDREKVRMPTNPRSHTPSDDGEMPEELDQKATSPKPAKRPDTVSRDKRAGKRNLFVGNLKKGVVTERY